MAGLIDDELRDCFRGRPRQPGLPLIRRRWAVIPLRIAPPLDENGLLSMAHPATCQNEAHELVCSPNDCRASLGLVKSVPVDDGESVAVLGGIADFLELALGHRLPEHDRVAEHFRGLAKGADRQWFLIGSEPLDDADDPVGKGIDVSSAHLDALRLATGSWFPSLTHEQLVEVYLVLDDEPDGTLGSPTINLVESPRTIPHPAATAEQITSATRLAFWGQLDDPTITVQELLMGSAHDLRLVGDYQSAVLKAAIAVEMTVMHISWMVEWEAGGRARRLPKRLRGAKPLDLIDEVLSRRLPHVAWDYSDQDSALGRWRTDVAQLRNDIMHVGRRPRSVDAYQCERAAVEISSFLREALVAASGRFPWTTLKWSTGRLIEAGTQPTVQNDLVIADGRLAAVDEIHERWLAGYLAASR